MIKKERKKKRQENGITGMEKESKRKKEGGFILELKTVSSSFSLLRLCVVFILWKVSSVGKRCVYISFCLGMFLPLLCFFLSLSLSQVLSACSCLGLLFSLHTAHKASLFCRFNCPFYLRGYLHTSVLSSLFLFFLSLIVYPLSVSLSSICLSTYLQQLPFHLST